MASWEPRVEVARGRRNLSSSVCWPSNTTNFQATRGPSGAACPVPAESVAATAGCIALLRCREPFGIGHIPYSACHYIGKNGLQPFQVQPALQSKVGEEMQTAGRQHRHQLLAQTGQLL